MANLLIIRDVIYRTILYILAVVFQVVLCTVNEWLRERTEYVPQL